MKKLTTLFLLLSICLLGLFSCKKDTEESFVSTFSAKVDGSVKTVITPPVAAFYADQNTVQIAGQFSTTTGISIMLSKPKTGTFDVGSDGVTAIYMPTNDPGVGFMGSSGKVIVTEWSETRIKGTFEFNGDLLTGDKKVVVTEGKFNIAVMKI